MRSLNHRKNHSDRRKPEAKHSWCLISLFVACIVLSASDARSDSFRCGKKVISSGDSAEELKRDCGQPQQRDFVQQELLLDEGLKKVRLERWHYKLAPKRLARTVLIHRGVVVEIRTGKR
jgi:hypothetical protein